MQVLERMGILPQVREVQTRTGATTIVNSANRRVAGLPDGFTSGEVELLRGDLARILYDATCHDAEYIFDDDIASLHEHEAGVEVTFRRGRPRTFDLVIGADGLHSNVRSLVFGPESLFIHHLGYYVSIFTVPNHLNLDHAALLHGVPGRMVGIFSAKNNTEATASFYFASPPLCYDRYDIAQQQQLLREHFSDMDWEVPRLLANLDHASDFYFDSISQIKMTPWSNGRVALLGDAAWCGSPLSGMGTGMAVVGASTLAGELKEAAGNHKIAFAHYESLMRGYVTRCQKLADGADWFVPKTRWKLWLRNQIWRALPHTPWKNMMLEVPMKAANSISPKSY